MNKKYYFVGLTMGEGDDSWEIRIGFESVNPFFF